MAGFGLDGINERIQCPYCGSFDCCGVDNKQNIICCHTGKIVSERSLKRMVNKDPNYYTKEVEI